VVLAVTGERSCVLMDRVLVIGVPEIRVHVCLHVVSNDGNDTSLVSSVKVPVDGRRHEGTMGA
jgi:hypothetical protein